MRVHPTLTIRSVMINKQFNYWKVIGESPKGLGDPYKKYWFCQCVCCVKKHVREDDLKSGKSKSCGCSRSTYLLNYIGQKFHHWKILSIGSIRNNHRYVKCECDCGYLADIRLSAIKTNQSKSCGCSKQKRSSHEQARPMYHQQTESQRLSA